ncbi:MAG: Glu/Leu/Phe/Val dehydrogenase [Chitinophagales bacterium]|nr:Glu/Leu/Phe/Val dehydrogenase [Chitinophagales bacterium]
MNVFEKMEEMEHEQIMFFNDNETGLKGIIAIHNSTLGPALGGTRLWKYASEEDAIKDVLRLSRGMSFKSSISGIHLGGGKAVIIDNPKAKKDEAFWRRYGKFVDNLGGKYITAEDVGTNTQFIEYISLETKHVAGKPDYLGGGGDPSPVTAYGVYLGMKAAQKQRSGNDSLQGKKIAVQGVGHVGQYLIDHLAKEGAKITICDINENNIKQVSAKHRVEVVSPEDIYGVDMDIYAPCALGASVNDTTIPHLKCGIIAGAANNQLAEEKKHGDLVKAKGIIYAPDFLINAGGVINCYIETVGYNRDRAYAATDKIYEQTLAVLQEASTSEKNSQEVALEIAMKRIEDIGKTRRTR